MVSCASQLLFWKAGLLMQNFPFYGPITAQVTCKITQRQRISRSDWPAEPSRRSKEAVLPTLSAVQQSELNNIKPSLQIAISDHPCLNSPWEMNPVGASCDSDSRPNSRNPDINPAGWRTKTVNTNIAWRQSPPSCHKTITTTDNKLRY